MRNVFFGFNPIGLLIAVCLILLGIYDLWQIREKGYSISEKVQRWFPPAGDYVVLSAIMAGIWAVLGPNYAITVICGVILGHFFWNGR